MSSAIRIPDRSSTNFAIFGVCWLLLHTVSFGQPDRSNDVDLLYGELDTESRLFRFLVEVPPDRSENTAKLRSLDEGNRTFQLQEFKLDEQSLSFELKETGVVFEGRVSRDISVLQGVWKQHGLELRLSFKRVSAKPIDSPLEIWRGTMNAGFQSLEIQVRGYEDSDGNRSYFLDSVSQSVGGFKARMKIEGSSVEIETPALRAVFRGTLNDDQTEITGTWKQQQSLKLNLVKVDSLATSSVVKPNRPQTPQPPYPYESREVTFQSEPAKSALNGVSFGLLGSGKIDLAGTLTVPHQEASNPGRKFPLAILISGSGPQDRDETLFDHKPFRVIADNLSRRGIAVLRYDERGVGQSKGDFASATTADFANDVKSAIAFAKSISDIDHANIGLIGHSEGGLVAPMVAAEEPGVAWIVLMAGPGVNGEQILYSQGALIIAAAGGTEEDQKKQRRLQELTFRAVQSPSGKGRIEALVSPIVDQLLEDMQARRSTNFDPSDSEAMNSMRREIEKQVRSSLLALKNPWFQFFAKHEPGPVLEKVRCPVLAINGSRDVQVDPKLNLPKIEEHLKRGGNQSIVLREFEGLNHLFQTSKTGGLSEYASIEETIAPVVLKEMGDWILSVKH